MHRTIGAAPSLHGFSSCKMLVSNVVSHHIFHVNSLAMPALGVWPRRKMRWTLAVPGSWVVMLRDLSIEAMYIYVLCVSIYIYNDEREREGMNIWCLIVFDRHTYFSLICMIFVDAVHIWSNQRRRPRFAVLSVVAVQVSPGGILMWPWYVDLDANRCWFKWLKYVYIGLFTHQGPSRSNFYNFCVFL